MSAATAVAPTATSREDEILQAVDSFIAVQAEWESDPRTPDVPTEFFEESIEDAIATADAGDVPAVCRELVTALGRLDLEWQQYVSGMKVGQLTKHGPRPADSFWAAVRAVINARKGAVRPRFVPPEPVFVLLEQKVSERQIALIWSVDGKGPFVGEFGPDILKIHAEAKNPGVHTADWVKEQNDKLQAVATKTVRRALLQTDHAESDRPVRSRDKFVPDPASIEQLLREGQFAPVIAKVKGVAIDVVYAEAERLGIAVAKPEVPTPAESTPGDTESPPPDPVDLDTSIRAMAADGTKGVPEITKALRENGFPNVSPQKVAAVLRSKRAAAEPTDGDESQ